MCGLFQPLSTLRGYHRAKLWTYTTSCLARNLEKRRKMHILRIEISHFQGKIRPWRRETGQNLIRHLWKRIFRWFRISNQISHSVFRSRDIGRSLNPILALFEENRNFKDEYLGGKFFFRHETWHDGSEPSFLPSDQKLAKSIA